MMFKFSFITEAGNGSNDEDLNSVSLRMALISSTVVGANSVNQSVATPRRI